MAKNDAGIKRYVKEKMRDTKVFPDKAYDPMKLFKQRLADDNDKNAPKHLQREDDVVKRQSKPKGGAGEKYSKIKKYLNKKK